MTDFNFEKFIGRKVSVLIKAERDDGRMTNFFGIFREASPEFIVLELTNDKNPNIGLIAIRRTEIISVWIRDNKETDFYGQNRAK